jgi:hypothetical protein
MKRLLLILLFIYAVTMQAQNLLKLQGTPIGSPSINYITNLLSTTVNLPSNAFDGNTSTYYASFLDSYTYVGLDLGTPHVITGISFVPRSGYSSKMNLGVFEGANRADFLDAIPLYLITSAPENGKTTQVTVTCSKGFRYVRYCSPSGKHCDVAELGFYGYMGYGNNSHLITFSGLPVVSIHTIGNIDVTVSKETYRPGMVCFISATADSLYLDSMNVKGRGNASWNFDKKPYKLKLAKKHKILGMPAKAKDWTLINNYGDKTLMRNLVAFDVSRRFGMRYTPVAQPVDVFFNGEFKGNFQLSDQIEVNKNRVNITEMDTSCTSLPNLSGGYLIEIDDYANLGDNYFYSTYYSTPVTIHHPSDDDILPVQKNYIKTRYSGIEQALKSSSYTSQLCGYRSQMDVNSFIDYFLINEVCGNMDTFWSLYMWLDRDSDKFYIGPVWDFDIAFNNDYRTYPLDNKKEFTCRIGGDDAPGTLDFFNRLMSDPTFVSDMKHRWSIARYCDHINVESLISVVDSLAGVLQQSQTLNFKRWPILSSKVHMNPRAAGSYAGEVTYLRDFIKMRVPWMDKKVGLEDSASVTAIMDLSQEQDVGHVVDGIYTIGGQRVLNMTHSGIYIIRRGNKIRKVYVP